MRRKIKLKDLESCKNGVKIIKRQRPMIIGVDVCLAQNIMGRVEWLFKCGLVLLSEIDILHVFANFQLCSFLHML